MEKYVLALDMDCGTLYYVRENDQLYNRNLCVSFDNHVINNLHIKKFYCSYTSYEEFPKVILNNCILTGTFYFQICDFYEMIDKFKIMNCEFI